MKIDAIRNFDIPTNAANREDDHPEVLPPCLHFPVSNNIVKTLITNLKRNEKPWWMELRDGVHPQGYRFYRKTKAGKWEKIATIANVLDVGLVKSWFEDLWSQEMKKYKHPGMKVTSLSGRQIFSTYYLNLYLFLSYKASVNRSFGLSINKGDEYLFYHASLQGNNLKPISDYFAKKSRQHCGIRAFHQAKMEKSDDYLYWGWLVFNDDYKISVAIDDDFKLFNQYKDNLKAINISYLVNTK